MRHPMRIDTADRATVGTLIRRAGKTYLVEGVTADPNSGSPGRLRLDVGDLAGQTFSAPEPLWLDAGEHVLQTF